MRPEPAAVVVAIRKLFTGEKKNTNKIKKKILIKPPTTIPARRQTELYGIAGQNRRKQYRDKLNTDSILPCTMITGLDWTDDGVCNFCRNELDGVH